MRHAKINFKDQLKIHKINEAETLWKTAFVSICAIHIKLEVTSSNFNGKVIKKDKKN